jgi:hypothetical protein
MVTAPSLWQSVESAFRSVSQLVFRATCRS